MGFSSLKTIILHPIQNDLQAMQNELRRMQNLWCWKQKDLLWMQNPPLEVDVRRCEPPIPRGLASVI